MTGDSLAWLNPDILLKLKKTGKNLMKSILASIEKRASAEGRIETVFLPLKSFIKVNKQKLFQHTRELKGFVRILDINSYFFSFFTYGSGTDVI